MYMWGFCLFDCVWRIQISPELACSEPVESVEGLHYKIKVPYPAQGSGAGLFIYKML